MALFFSFASWSLSAQDLPGAINSKVTQTNIHQTICRRGWVKHIRPPSSFTNRLKAQQIAERGLPGDPSDYEEDHIISLELGGAPLDPANLVPQPWPEAREKDKEENRLNRQVCAGAIGLAEAQQSLRTWKLKP